MTEATIDIVSGAIAAQSALMLALVDQGVADRERLKSFFTSLVDDLSEVERTQPYGMILAAHIAALNSTDPTKPRRPDWFRGTVDGGRGPATDNDH